MSELSSKILQEAVDLQTRLEEWQDGNPYRSTLSVSLCMDPDDKEHPYSAVASLQGNQGAVLAALEHLINYCPEMADIMAIAIEKARHRQQPVT